MEKDQENNILKPVSTQRTPVFKLDLYLIRPSRLLVQTSKLISCCKIMRDGVNE